METKRKRFMMILSFVLVLSAAASSSAGPITQLYVVRASNNSLWVSACYGGYNCPNNTWTSIPGQLASQPTLIFDMELKRYVLTGVASNGSIWQSTFDINGTFQNDWVNVAGNGVSIATVGGPSLIGWAEIRSDGTVLDCSNCDPSNTSHQGTTGSGWYQVAFLLGNIENFPASAVLDAHNETNAPVGEIGIAPKMGNSSAYWVQTFNSSGAGADLPFTILVYQY